MEPDCTKPLGSDLSKAADRALQDVGCGGLHQRQRQRVVHSVELDGVRQYQVSLATVAARARAQAAKGIAARACLAHLALPIQLLQASERSTVSHRHASGNCRQRTRSAAVSRSTNTASLRCASAESSMLTNTWKRL
jgi:hypothetical protein